MVKRWSVKRRRRSHQSGGRSTPPATRIQTPIVDCWYIWTHSDRELVCRGWFNDRIVDAVDRNISKNLWTLSQTTLRYFPERLPVLLHVAPLPLRSSTAIVCHRAIAALTWIACVRICHWSLTSLQTHSTVPNHVAVDGALVLQLVPVTNSSDCGAFRRHTRSNWWRTTSVDYELGLTLSKCGLISIIWSST